MKQSTHYLASISIKTLRDFILDNNISNSDSITLSQNHFDEIVLSYRKSFNEPITFPYYLLGVLVKEDESNRIAPNGILIIYDDPESGFFESSVDEFYDGEIAYRCGWCGSIVDYDGSELTYEQRSRMQRYIEQTSVKAIQKQVDGVCCKGRRAEMMAQH